MTIKRLLLILLMVSPAAAFWIADYVNRHAPAESGPAYLALFAGIFLSNVSVLLAIISAGAGVFAATKGKSSLDWWAIAIVNLTVLYPYGLLPIWYLWTKN